MSKITIEDLDLLRRMLGWVDKKNRGYRNHYYLNNSDSTKMTRLLNGGFVEKGQVCHDYTYYHATSKGMDLAGLTKKEKERALEE